MKEIADTLFKAALIIFFYTLISGFVGPFR
jgi:hypothetical protein